MDKKYIKQVDLLLKILPEVGKETNFALYGGTAINLFIRDMPRLSVDIDLLYIPKQDRPTTLMHIERSLESIKDRLEKVIPRIIIRHAKEKGKLFISVGKVLVKLEVNLVNRGTLSHVKKLPLCSSARNTFDKFVAIQVIPFNQLYGGKIRAALDRQHPRDIFDVKYLLEIEGFTDSIKEGFILALLSSDRPIHEILRPHLQDQKSAMRNQFDGMTFQAFDYTDFERIRENLIKTVHHAFTLEEKNFLMSFINGDPNWDFYDFSSFPAVKWKLKNIVALKSSNNKKHTEQVHKLKEVLWG